MLAYGVAVLILIGAVPAATGAQQAAAPASLVFDGVTVVDVEHGKLLPAQRVVIIGNRIQSGGVPVPARARVIDARGKYLIPGLWDMHVHPAIHGENHTDVFYPLFIANGVTGVRDAGSNTSLATFARWKQEIAAGTRVGPRLIVAGPSIDQCQSSPSADFHICVATPSEARLAVDFLKQAGADFIKPYMMSRELYIAIAAESRRVGIPFGGHFHAISGLEASDSGARFLDHRTWFEPNVCGEESDVPSAFDRGQCAAAAAHLRRNNTWIVQTPRYFGLGLFPELYVERVQRYLPDSVAKGYGPHLRRAIAIRDSVAPAAPRRPTSLADWRAALTGPAGAVVTAPWTTKAGGHDFADTRGLPILAGTDAEAPFSVSAGFELHDMLAYFVLGGMTPLEALQTATLNPAKALGATDSLGAVAAGKLADLVLLDANPLADIWNTTKIRAVVANGHYFDRTALDRLLGMAERAAHR